MSSSSSSSSSSTDSTITMISYLSLFVIIFGYYYFLKPANTADFDPGKFATFFIMIIVSQVVCNTALILKRCSGSLNKNIGAAFLITFIPWFVIFGITNLILLMMPEMKAVFADVVGYFWVSSSANQILVDLLVDANVQRDISLIQSPEEKSKLQIAADAIVKICSDKSLLINQITPLNFDKYWNGVLNPLMKQQYKKLGSPENEEMKKKFFAVVLSRDNVGEAFWFSYMAVLLLSLTNFKIMSYQCETDAATMKQTHGEYLEQKAAVENQTTSSTVYKV